METPPFGRLLPLVLLLAHVAALTIAGSVTTSTVLAAVSSPSVSPSTAAQGATIRGFLQVEPSAVSIHLMKDGKTDRLAIPIEADLTTLGSLLSLQTGDYLVATGKRVGRTPAQGGDFVTVVAIESVGLRSLLGSWKTSDWDVLQFEDFSRAVLYSAVFPHRDRYLPLALTARKDIHYALAPERTRSYSIFMIENPPSAPSRSIRDPSPVVVGRLKQGTPQAFEIEVFDTHSGKVSSTFQFTRFPGFDQ